MKVCVFGAGAVGGHIAGRLAKGGAEVSVVARGAYLDAIREHGLTVQAADGEIHARPRASDDPRQLGPQDWVIVTVKAPALASIAAGIGPLLGPQTPVLFLMNGIPWWYFYRHGGKLDGRRLPLIDPGDAIWNAIGPERAVGGVAYSACTVVRPGVILVENRRSRLVLGEPDLARTDRLGSLADVLASGGIGIELTEHIRDAIWSKLILNMGSAPFGILTQAAPKDVYAEPALAAAGRAIAKEVLAIAAGMGCRPTHDADAQVATYLQMEHKPSALQDLELGRPMEIDGMFVAPLELARLAGVPTPLLDLLVSLVKVRARAAGLYS